MSNYYSNNKKVQAVVVADTFEENFAPISNEIPLCLLPLLNRPLIDYTLEFLAKGGVTETILFCSKHPKVIKAHIEKIEKQRRELWTDTMTVKVVVSETCRSFGDCLRDLFDKSIIRHNFVLVGPGTIANLKLVSLLKVHAKNVKKDRSAAMTLILTENSAEYFGRCPNEEFILGTNNTSRVTYFHKINPVGEQNIQIPARLMDTMDFLLMRNLLDTHVAICSPTTLSLFVDNFDFQTKDDFVKCLLVDDDMLEATIYYYVPPKAYYGNAVTNWRRFHVLSQELQTGMLPPFQARDKGNRIFRNRSVLARKVLPNDDTNMINCAIGRRVKIGLNVHIENSIIYDGTVIGNDVLISNSVVGFDCTLKSKCKITAGSIIGNGVVIEDGVVVEKCHIQATKPEKCDETDIVGTKAYKVHVDSDDDDEEPDEDEGVDRLKPSNLTQLLPADMNLKEFQGFPSEENAEDEEDKEDDSDDRSSGSFAEEARLEIENGKKFYVEVLESLTRGFEEKLPAENLILEVNSSRFAYNTLDKLVSSVTKVILNLSKKLPIGPQFFSHFRQLLSYFYPILRNYVRDESEMEDILQAVEEVWETISPEETQQSWIRFFLRWCYEKDLLTEDIIINWHNSFDDDSLLKSQTKVLVDWLEESDSSSSEESE